MKYQVGEKYYRVYEITEEGWEDSFVLSGFIVFANKDTFVVYPDGFSSGEIADLNSIPFKQCCEYFEGFDSITETFLQKAAPEWLVTYLQQNNNDLNTIPPQTNKFIPMDQTTELFLFDDGELVP